jgi:hypothetical protein
MNSEDQLEEIAKRRLDIAKKVINAPQYWKVCVGPKRKLQSERAPETFG